MKALYISGKVMVSDILLAFEPMVEADLLLMLDKVLASRMNDRLSFDDCEVSTEHAVDALDEADELLVAERLNDALDESDVRILAEAIRTGNIEAAELAMDRMFADNSELREWIDRGRYSSAARSAVRPAGANRKAA